jgi:3'-5' exoribonuclease
MFDEQTLPTIENMPSVFRIVSTSCVPAPNRRGVSYRVELYHDKAQLAVAFTRSQPDIRLRAGLLVSVRWKLPVTTDKGAVQISRLVLLEQPIKGVNPFEMVPPRWVRDRNLVRKARDLLDALPDNLRQLVCAIFWDGVRFGLFCDRPASIRDHHSKRNGNLRHTVEVAEMVRSLAGQYPQANLGISLAAALLHDAGKAAEYGTWGNGGWRMTDRGKLVGHRHTVLEWIAVAMAKNRGILSERHHLSLLHALTSAPNAEWLGIRSPATPEATLLSMAYRLSNESAMTTQWANRHIGRDDRHPDRRGKPFTLPWMR